MKCEKCGTEILEGTLCENCKSGSVINENTISEVPQAYDPVADLMNEPVYQKMLSRSSFRQIAKREKVLFPLKKVNSIISLIDLSFNKLELI